MKTALETLWTVWSKVSLEKRHKNKLSPTLGTGRVRLLPHGLGWQDRCNCWTAEIYKTFTKALVYISNIIFIEFSTYCHDRFQSGAK